MPPESNVESTLVWYKVEEENYKYWTDELSGFIESKNFKKKIHCRARSFFIKLTNFLQS